MPHPLKNFEMQTYYQNEPKINGVYSGNNLPKIKVGAYVINLGELKAIGTNWIALYLNGNKWRASYNAIYFYSFKVGDISKEIIKFIGNKNIIVIIYRSIRFDTSIQFDNVWILLYWLYWFYVKRKKFARLYKFIFS